MLNNHNIKKSLAIINAFLLYSIFCLNAGAEESKAKNRSDPSLSISNFVLFSALPLSELYTENYRKKRISSVSGYIHEIHPYLKKERKPEKQDELMLRKWRLRQHIICISGKSASGDAERFLSGLPLSIEWEGIPEAPLAEAAYAQKWIENRPDSKIIPFVHLFCAHRFRAVSEIFCFQKNTENIEKFYDLYISHIKAAISSNSEKIKCIADDMKGLSHVYISCH